MRYGHWYKTYDLSPKLIAAVEDFVRPKERLEGTIVNPQDDIRRKSHLVWIDDPWIAGAFLEVSRVANRETGWDFDIEGIQTLQYTEYYPGGEYSWHTDQNRTSDENGLVRKFSFSVFLNDDFEGGEFDIELFGPHKEERCATFAKVKPNTALFFQADMWHRVRPVKSGTRRSLVGWLVGKKFR